MSRNVAHDGAGSLVVRFPFDRSLVDRIKTLPNRRWNAAERYWTVPDSDVVLVVDLLREDRFEFDQTTQELYAAQGGTARLATPTLSVTSLPDPAGRPLLPGLFDTPVVAPQETNTAEADHTVTTLNEAVKRVLEGAFPQPVWLVGEISGFNKSAHRRHVGFQLVEVDEGGKKLAEVSATLFEDTRRQIAGKLTRAGDPFRLEDEITVRLHARVELYVPWGSYRVIVEDLDVNYTLGEAARRREEILRKLAEEQLLERNRQLTMPAFPLRLGLITSLGSDAFNDVKRTLDESGLAFELTAHGARVQGRQTEGSVLNALDWFRERADGFDAVLICRGGGSRTDLAWFDSEALGRAVATFPLPVIVGIGHEQDHSVLDEVGRRAKTPTAAAAMVVEIVAASMEALESRGARILELAGEQIAAASLLARERGRRLTEQARALLVAELHRLDGARRRTVLGARERLGLAREGLMRLTTGIPRSARLELTRSGADLEARVRALRLAARRELSAAELRLAPVTARLAPLAARVLAAESERTTARQRRLRLADPRRVIERGYTVLRREDGTVITRAAEAPEGTRVEAELREGRLRLRSEGGD